MSLFEELKRRNVFRVGTVYLVATWLLLQITDVLAPILSLPEWAPKLMFLILAIGFLPVLIFAWAFELTPEGLKREKEVNRDASITNVTARKLDFITIGLLVAAIAVVAVDRLLPHDASDAAAKPEQTSSSQSPSGVAPGNETAVTPDAENVIPAQAAIQAKSIAVLPFVNMSSDPEQEYFSDGISEEILNALAQIKDLKVAGRTSSFAFKGQNQDLRRIGETLGVANILEGSVRKSGTKVRITAQLIQVKDGFHLWSETYDRELDDVFAIQDEIANAILEQLKTALAGENATVVAAERTDSRAYDRYLLAKQRMSERKEAPLQSAAALLDEAIVLDPNYAPAYAQRAITALLLRDDSYGSIPKAEALAQAKLYIDKALLLDPELAEANAALGLYYINQPGEAQQAVDALRKALAVNPNLVDAANWLSSSLFALGKIEEAIEVSRRLTELDPFYRPGISGNVTFNNLRGETGDSWAYLERISPFFPDDPLLISLKGDTYLAEGHLAEALPLMESASQREPGNRSYREGLGAALIYSGQYERAAEVSVPWIQAWALALLGRPEEASIITTKMAASGEDVSSYIRFAVMAGEYAEVIAFFEARWPDFAAFERDFPPIGDNSIWFLYADLAQAYAAIGNDQRFKETMIHFRAQLDGFHKLGFDVTFLYFYEALYLALAGDHENALVNLGLAVDKGYFGYPRISTEWAQFKPLEGDPEFEAIQDRMVEQLNAERAKLDLGPMTI